MVTRTASARRLGSNDTVELRVVVGGIPSPSEISELVALPKNWAIEFHRDPAGATNIVLLPDPIDDAVGPTLVIYGDGPVVRMDAMRWDTYSSIGEYGAVADALEAASKLIHEATAAECVH